MYWHFLIQLFALPDQSSVIHAPWDFFLGFWFVHVVLNYPGVLLVVCGLL